MEYITTFNTISPVPETQEAVKKQVYTRLEGSKTGKTHAKWGDKIPGVGNVAGLLPNWPRWLRITVTLGIIGLVVAVFWVLL